MDTRRCLVDSGMCLRNPARMSREPQNVSRDPGRCLGISKKKKTWMSGDPMLRNIGPIFYGREIEEMGNFAGY